MPRPSQNILSRRIIAQAALKLVERTGDFTIPGIAKDLGVNPSSLYHHVKGGRNEIIDIMREVLYERIELEPFTDRGTPWSRRFAGWVRAYRTSMATFPKVLPLLVRKSVDDELTLKLYDAAFALLDEAGIPPEEQVDVMTTLDILVLGSALDALAPTPLWRPGEAEVPTLARAALSGDDVDRSRRGLEIAIEALADHILRRGSAARPEAESRNLEA